MVDPVLARTLPSSPMSEDPRVGIPLSIVNADFLDCGFGFRVSGFGLWALGTKSQWWRGGDLMSYPFALIIINN